MIPMPSHDGPRPDELRVRQMLGRICVSDALAREMAGLAYAVPEKSERRA